MVYGISETNWKDCGHFDISNHSEFISENKTTGLITFKPVVYFPY